MPPDPQPIPLDPPVDHGPALGTVAGAIAEVKRLQEEARVTAEELDRALDRLRDLTEAANEPTPRRREGARIPSAAPDIPNDALLRATRMAMEGTARDAIAKELREEFDIEEPERLLDEVLGGERRR